MLQVSGNDNSSALAPNSGPRFPSARNPRPFALSSSAHNSPSSNLRPSKGLPSPSKSAGSFPSNNLSSKAQQAPPTGLSPFSRASPSSGMGVGPVGGRSPGSKAANLGFGLGDKAEDRTSLQQKYRLKSPSRVPPSLEGGLMIRTKAQGAGSFNTPHRMASMEGKSAARGVAIRKRANTEPTSPTPLSWMNGRGKGRGSTKQTGTGGGKYVLCVLWYDDMKCLQT